MLIIIIIKNIYLYNIMSLIANYAFDSNDYNWKWYNHYRQSGNGNSLTKTGVG